MRGKILAILLTVALVGSTISCGKLPPTTDETAENTETLAAEDNLVAVSTTDAGNNANAASAEASSDAAAETEVSSEPVITGGFPWIDSDIKENVTADTVVNPKDDFHLYANKDWILGSEIPEGYTSLSHYIECGLNVKNRCIELLNDESVTGHDADLIRTYNKLILDWDARNALGVSEIQEGFDKILEVKNIDDVTKLITDGSEKSIYFDFVGYGVSTGLNDPDNYIAIISQPSLLLNDSAEYSERTEYGDMIYGYRKELFRYITGKLGMSEADADKYFDAAIEFETKLAKKIYTTEERLGEDYFDKINNEMSFDEAVSFTKTFPLEELLSINNLKYDGIYLVMAPDYLKLLDEVYTDENIEGIKGVIMVYYVNGYAGIVDKDTYDKMIELNNTYYGTSGSTSDEEMAYEKVVGMLPASMQKVYIEKYGSKEDKKRMEDLCREVIDTYREMLSENTWASDEIKNYAIEKLDKMVIHAAYPDKFRDTSKIDIADCSLIEAYIRIVEYQSQYNCSQLGKKVDKEMWAEGFNILDCNAYYSQTDNTVNMIIGMMGEPFYSNDMSIEELYASIGAFWVGHEVSHAFDSTGAQFDAEGVYRDWWTEKDKEEFDKRVKKMDDYLDTIIAFDGKHFIGSNIDTEMVADMTGLQCALRMASKVEGFDYDKFFTKYAQMNGSIMLYKGELSQLTQDPHPLNYSRTNVPVQQFEEFYETYDIKEGDGMYLAPEDRLLVW